MTSTAQTGSPDGAGANTAEQSLTGSATARQDWVQQTINASSQDARRQPWKQHFANTVVESRFDDGQDLVIVKKSKTVADDDDGDDSSCPFQIQGSSLAA